MTSRRPGSRSGAVAGGSVGTTVSRALIGPEQVILLAIETTCDETAAAVLEGPDPPHGRAAHPFERGCLAGWTARTLSGAWCPRSRSRAHVRQILPMIDEALRSGRGHAGRPGGGRRGDPAGAGRRPGRRTDGCQGSWQSRWNPAGRRRSPRGPSLRLPARISRSGDLSLRGIGNLGGSHQPLPVPGPDPLPNFSAARPMMPPARRSTRSPACWDWAIPAVRRLSGLAKRGNPAGVCVSAVLLARRTAAAELFRPQDGGSLLRSTARTPASS